MKVTVRNAEVDGARVDVTLVEGRAAVFDGTRLDAQHDAEHGAEDEFEIDAAGDLLLPGLHDHHLHLLAMAAASLDCRRASTLADLGVVLRSARGADPESWIRATGYHESIGGDLDRHVLDRLLPDRPVRIQHRSGALWMLNSAALRAVAPALDRSADVERDRYGEPTGRLWRYDTRLRTALPAVAPDLSAVGDRLLRLGITGVTDATPEIDAGAIGLIADAQATGALPQDVTLLGAPDTFTDTPRLRLGPAKLLLRDHDLPDVDEVAAWIEQRHRADRAVAVHCVTSDSLVITLAALESVGVHPGDRIEHGAVVPPSLGSDLARLGVRVVTNPGFLRERGDSYLADVHPDELPFLYPYRSLDEAGIRVAAASDAPYGDPDPWHVIAAAASRTAPSGACLTRTEIVSPERALAGYLSPAAAVGSPPETLRIGARRGLCLVDRSWAAESASPEGPVRLSVAGGHIGQITLTQLTDAP